MGHKRDHAIDRLQVLAAALLVLGIGALGLSVAGARAADAEIITSGELTDSNPESGGECGPNNIGRWLKFVPIQNGAGTANDTANNTTFALGYSAAPGEVTILQLLDTSTGNTFGFTDVIVFLGGNEAYLFATGGVGDTFDTGANGNVTQVTMCALIPGMTISKVITDADNDYFLDEQISYQITVTNTGNVPLTDVDVQEKIGVELGICTVGATQVNPLPLAVLDVGESLVCTALHFVEDEDLVSQTYVNSATATAAELPNGVGPASAVADLFPSTNLTITKTIEPEPNPVDPTEFTINVVCGVNFSTSVVLQHNVSDIVQVPAGSTCTVTEQASPGFTTTVIGLTGGNGGEVVMDENQIVDFINTRVLGSLVINKTTTGGFGGPFTFSVDCDNDTYDIIDPPLTITTLAANTAVSTATGTIPAGVSCTVTETGGPTVPGTLPGDPVVPLFTQTVPANDGTVIVPIVAGPNNASFTNARALGDIVITKTTVRPQGSTYTDTFDFTITCPGVAGSPFARSITIDSVTGSGTATVVGIPTGSTCTITETDPPGDEWLAGDITPNGGVIVVSAGDNNVTVPNQLLVDGLQIVKNVSGTTAMGVLNDTFNFAVDCTVDSVDTALSITTTGGTGGQIIPNVPNGTTCVVTETVPQLWTLVSATPPNAATAPTNDAVVTMVAGGSNVATFTNSRDIVDFTIDKTIDISTGQHTFNFTVECSIGAGPAVEVTGSPFSITLAAGDTNGTVLVPNVPSDASCTITETAHPDFVQSLPLNGQPVVLDDIVGTETATFVNARETARISLLKTALGGNGVFDFDIDCPGTDFDEVVQITTLLLGGALSDPIPTGLVCTVTELPEAGWAQLLPLQGAADQVTVEADSPNLSLFVNGILEITTTKVVVNPPVGGFDLGETITFEITVDNTGLADLHGVTVVENTLGVTLGACTQDSNPVTIPLAAALGPLDDPVVCSATHVVTQADMDAGSFENVATGSGHDPADPTDTVSDPGNATADMDQQPAMTIDKTATSSGPYNAGSNITYDIVVTNTGNVTLHNVEVTESQGATLGGCTPAAPATLAPTASMTCKANHAVTQADIQAGTYTNTATADSTETEPVNAELTLPIIQNPELTVVKDVAVSPAPPAGGYTVGSTIHYTIVATNTGNLILTGVEITDSGVGVILGDCTPITPAALNPGESVICDATHVVTQADIDNGLYANTAVADSDQTEPVQDTAFVSLPQNESLVINKVARPLSGPVAVGTVITFDITATNNGTVTLTNVTVQDLTPTATLGTCQPATPVASLAPGASITCTATHIITQADLNLGTYTNVAQGDSDQTDPVTDSEVVQTPNPAVDLAIVKRSLTTFTIGEQANYQLDVRNNGPGFEPTPIVTDTLPTGLTFVSAQGPNWQCNNVGNTVTCLSTDGVAAGQNLPAIVITVLVNANTPATVSNTAIVSGTRVDTLPANNESTATAAVTAVLGQVVEPPAPAPAAQPTFAVTGASSMALATTGVGSILAGLVLLILRRRRETMAR